jgi:hypothetical protein
MNNKEELVYIDCFYYGFYIKKSELKKYNFNNYKELQNEELQNGKLQNKKVNTEQNVEISYNLLNNIYNKFIGTLKFLVLYKL